MSRLAVVALLVVLSTGCGADRDEPSAPRDSGRQDSGRPDTSVIGDLDSGEDTGGEELDAPEPVEDTSSVEDFGPPPPGSRVTATIGPEGGTLEGMSGTLLEGVKLVVPAGALSSPVLLAIDAAATPAPPSGGTLVSRYVQVGPDGVAFAAPARLTLPWSSTTTAPQLAMIARIGFAWSSLHDPSLDGTSITASMRRTSGAAVAEIDLSSTTPTITAVAPSGAGVGATVFIEGSGFGIAQVARPGVEGGAPFGTKVTSGGVVAETLAWSDGAISIRVPAGGGGTITVTTPGGSASK